MKAADVLTQFGIVMAPDVVTIAAQAGLDLACAAVLLDKESGGGHNVWGHDKGPTGGNYVKGAPVTKTAYLAYKAHRATLGNQGVGPCQLTFPSIQDQADQLDGCWDWSSNCTIGFHLLRGHIAKRGVQLGFTAYNGSGAAAQAYGKNAMKRLIVWQQRLANASSTTAGSSGGFLMALTDAEQAEILAGIRALKPGLVLPARSTNCRTPKDDEYGHTMNAEAEAADARAIAEQALAEIKALRAALNV